MFLKNNRIKEDKEIFAYSSSLSHVPRIFVRKIMMKVYGINRGLRENPILNRQPKGDHLSHTYNYSLVFTGIFLKPLFAYRKKINIIGH